MTESLNMPFLSEKSNIYPRNRIILLSLQSVGSTVILTSFRYYQEVSFLEACL